MKKYITTAVRTIRKRLGLGNDVKSHVRVHLPTEPEETVVSVGPYVKTEFETPCAECGDDNHYFHEYFDYSGFGWTRKLRCRDCYLEKHGDTSEIPVPSEPDEDIEQTAVYSTIDPRDVFGERA